MAWDDTKSANLLIASAEWNAMVTDQKSRALDSDLTAHTGSAAIHIDWTSATQPLLTTGTVSAGNFVLPTQFTSLIVPTSGNFIQVTGRDAFINYTSGAGFTYEPQIGEFHYFKVDNSESMIIGKGEVSFQVPAYGTAFYSTSAAPTTNDQLTPKKYVDDGLATKSSTAHVHSAGDLSDVTVTSPADGNILRWATDEFVVGDINNVNGTLSVNKGGTGRATELPTGELLIGNGWNAMNTLAQTSLMGVVVHDATAGTARPSGFDVVYWIGSVEPTNAINNDIWLDTA